MIRSKLGKKFVAFLCALVLFAESVVFPVTQARAASAALTAVGFGVTLSAFLAACGIYPYWTENQESASFDWNEWEEDSLLKLLDEYNAANALSPLPQNQIRAFLQGATLVVGSALWDKLRAFAEWIVDKYSVTDNQTGVELGEDIDSLPALPVVVSGVSGALPVASLDYANFSLLSRVSPADIFCFYYIYFGVYHIGLVTRRNGADYICVRSGSSTSASPLTSSTVIDNSTLYYAEDVYMNGNLITSPVGGINATIPIFDSFDDGLSFFVGGGGFEGLTADTSVVSIPAPLPADTEYGGLRVSGLPAATMAETVIDAVQDSVGERLKTPVDVVDVELASGTEIDSETGVITQNPVVIEAPVQETIPALSALAPSQEFVAAMMEALQTKFPFCLPFDFMRVLQAFVKPPDAPVIMMEFHDRMGGGTYTITVDLEPWDDIAAVVRRLESMILFLGFWLNFDKFNVLNIILGQIG